VCAEEELRKGEEGRKKKRVLEDERRKWKHDKKNKGKWVKRNEVK